MYKIGPFFRIGCQIEGEEKEREKMKQIKNIVMNKSHFGVLNPLYFSPCSSLAMCIVYGKYGMCCAGKYGRNPQTICKETRQKKKKKNKSIHACVAINPKTAVQ